MILSWLKLYNHFFKNQNFVSWSRRSCTIWIQPTFPTSSYHIKIFHLLITIWCCRLSSFLICHPFSHFNATYCLYPEHSISLIAYWGRHENWPLRYVYDHRKCNWYRSQPPFSEIHLWVCSKAHASHRLLQPRDSHGKTTIAGCSLGGTVVIWWLPLVPGHRVAFANIS